MKLKLPSVFLIAFISVTACSQLVNAQSWTLLGPDVEVILFGDEEGTAKFSRSVGVRHEPQRG